MQNNIFQKDKTGHAESHQVLKQFGIEQTCPINTPSEVVEITLKPNKPEAVTQNNIFQKETEPESAPTCGWAVFEVASLRGDSDLKLGERQSPYFEYREEALAYFDENFQSDWTNYHIAYHDDEEIPEQKDRFLFYLCLAILLSGFISYYALSKLFQ